MMISQTVQDKQTGTPTHKRTATTTTTIIIIIIVIIEWFIWYRSNSWIIHNTEEIMRKKLNVHAVNKYKNTKLIILKTYHLHYVIAAQMVTRGQSNLTKSASRGANSPVRGHPRGSKVVPLNSWGRVSY